MDELTRGLSLLGPKLEQLTRQIDQLGVQVSELRAIVSKKADFAYAEELQEQLQRLCGSLAESQKHAVKREHFNKLNASVQEMCTIVASKAEANKLEQLDQQLKGITDTISKKADALQVHQLSQELQALRVGHEASFPAQGQEWVSSELGSLKDTISSELKSLKERVESRAEAASVAKLCEDMAEKAEGKIVDQLNEKFRSLSTSLAQKAEFTEFEQLKSQVDALRGGAAQRAEEHRSELKRVSQQLHEALNSTVGSQETEKKLCDLEQQVQKVHEQKADGEKVEALRSQLKVLSDVLSPKIRATSPRPRSARGRTRA